MEYKVKDRVICYNSFHGKIVQIDKSNFVVKIDKSNFVVKIDKSCMMLCNIIYIKPEKE